MFDGRWLAGVDKARRPVGAAIRRVGVTADHLTALGLVMAAATAVALATGRLVLGLGLLAAMACADLFDGPVAKASGTAGPRGAFFDSVADRVSDSLVLGGLAWHLASEHGGHLAVLPLAVLATSNLISYERAKAESLGYSAKGGLMERAERIGVLALALAWSALLVPLLWAMLALTVLTAVQRFATVWRQASADRRQPAGASRAERAADRQARDLPARPERLRTARLVSQARWRAGRESVDPGGRARRSGGWRPRAQDGSRRWRAGSRP